eukprot:2166037-Ditylum_brightwellii.AAC.1
MSIKTLSLEGLRASSAHDNRQLNKTQQRPKRHQPLMIQHIIPITKVEKTSLVCGLIATCFFISKEDGMVVLSIMLRLLLRMQLSWVTLTPRD